MSESRPSYDELLDAIRRLQRQVEALQTENARPQTQLERARRAGKRQAAPFRKGPPKPDPKTPGRKSGDAHGGHGHRPSPPPDEVLEAALPEVRPGRGGALVEADVPHRYRTKCRGNPGAASSTSTSVTAPSAAGVCGAATSCEPRTPWATPPVNSAPIAKPPSPPSTNERDGRTARSSLVRTPRSASTSAGAPAPKSCRGRVNAWNRRTGRPAKRLGKPTRRITGAITTVGGHMIRRRRRMRQRRSVPDAFPLEMVHVQCEVSEMRQHLF